MNHTLIGILVIVAVCIIWYIWQQNLRKNAQKYLEKSNGTFDTNAQKALNSIDKIQCPTPQDHFTVARVIDLNAHEGRINNVRVLDNVVDRYMTNLRPDRRGGEDLDWFEIDQIENFAERHMDIMAANPHYNDFIEAVLQKRPGKVVKTIQQAKSDSDSKTEAFSTYVSSNKTHTDDTQNVHDSAVNEHLRKTYGKLKDTTPPSLDTAAVTKEIKSHIQQRFSTGNIGGKKMKIGD